MIEITLGGHDWEKEFRGLDLGDRRLSKRLFKVMDALAEAPDKSILAASGGRAAAKGAYRLFSSDSLTEEDLMASIARATAVKVQESDCSRYILIPQDTTKVSYGCRDGIENMGYYCDSEQKGMLTHSAIAVTDTGLPLGLVHQYDWTREERKNTAGTKEQLTQRSIEDKESFRWIETMHQAADAIPDGVRALSVCDREGDFYELFAAAEAEDELFLVRLVQNRMTAEGKRLFDRVKESEAQAQISIRVGRKPSSRAPERTARMELRFMEVEIMKPARRREEGLPKSLRLTAVHVREIGAPAGEKPLEWFLLTNAPVETASDAAEFVRFYALRWLIERFHYVLKSGCRIEELQAHSFERIKVLVLLYSVVAMQLLTLTYAGRLDPDLPADLFWNEHEWQTLYRAAHKTRALPQGTYTLRDSLHDIAILGGRKLAPSDGEPGVKALWEGLMRLYTLLEYKAYIA